MAGKPWFRRRRYGWGLQPASWQGWAVTAAYVAAVFVLAVTLSTPQPYLFWTLFGLATAAFLLVAFLKRGG